MAKTVGNCFCHTKDFYRYSFDSLDNDIIMEIFVSKPYNANWWISKSGFPVFVSNCDPSPRKQLISHFMILKRGHQTDNAIRNAFGDFRKGVMSIKFCVRQLINSSIQADHFIVFDHS